MLTYTRKTQSVGRWETSGAFFQFFSQRTKQSFQIIIGYVSLSYFMKQWNIQRNNFLSSPLKWSSSTGGLNASPAPQGLATQWKTKFIWNCLMHYLSNNQGSQFILQIIIAFVALIAKISQSSEPLTGRAFSGKRRHWVCSMHNAL